jgi:uncharacterized protein
MIGARGHAVECSAMRGLPAGTVPSMPTPSYQQALVTGASSGIGAAWARALAARGADLVLVARREDRLRALADELAAGHGVGVEVLAADLTDARGLEAAVDRAGADQAPVDLLVNNAGFGTGRALVNIDPARLDAEVRLDVGAVVALTRAALPGMLERGHGAVVNVSSVVGFQPVARLATYSASKAFVTAFTEALAEEVRGTGVQVQALCPGLTRTEFQQVSSPERPTRAPGFLWQEADEVVAASLDGLARGRVVVVPGLHNRGAVTVNDLLPRALRRRLVTTVQRLRGA